MAYSREELPMTRSLSISAGILATLWAGSVVTPASGADDCAPTTAGRFAERRYLVARPVEETVERVIVRRPITETVEREERVTVLRPVVETTQQQQRVIVRKPVVENAEREERVMVRRPVYETFEREERFVVLKPVTEKGERDEQYVVQEPVCTCRYVDSGTGALTEVPETSLVNRVVTRRVPVESVRYVEEQQVRKVPVQTVRYVEQEEVRKVPVQTVRYVEEEQVRSVPVQTVRYVEQQEVRKVPTIVYRVVEEEVVRRVPATSGVVYEERVEIVPVDGSHSAPSQQPTLAPQRSTFEKQESSPSDANPHVGTPTPRPALDSEEKVPEARNMQKPAIDQRVAARGFYSELVPVVRGPRFPGQ
jgi:hypothetical protein